MLHDKLISLTAEEARQKYEQGQSSSVKTLNGLGIQPIGDSISQLETIISSIIGVITIIGVIYFTIQIILSGFALIASQGDPKELETGKKRLTNNVMGLAIIVLAYGIGALITNLLGIKDVFNLQTVLGTIH